MPDVVFTSDSSQIERVLQRLEEQNAKLIQQNRLLAQQTKQSSVEVVAGLGKQIQSLQTMAVRYVAIEQVVSRVVAQYSAWDQRMTSLAQKSRELSKNLTHDFASAGDLPRSAEVERYISSQPLASREQVRLAYSGVSGATPTSSLETRLDLAGQAVRVAPLVGDLRAFGNLLGEIQDALPNRTAADNADLALSLQSRAGNDADKLVRDSTLRSIQLAIDSGAIKTPEHGFALGLKALDAKLPPETIEKIFNATNAQYEVRKPTPGQYFSREDRAYNQFASSSPEKRLGLLLSDQTVAQAILGRESIGRLNKLDASDVDRLAAELQADERRDFVGEQLGYLNSTRAGRASLREQKLISYKDWKSREGEDSAERVNELREISAANPSFVGGAVDRGRTEAAILDSRIHFSTWLPWAAH